MPSRLKKRNIQRSVFTVLFQVHLKNLVFGIQLEWDCFHRQGPWIEIFYHSTFWRCLWISIFVIYWGFSGRHATQARGLASFPKTDAREGVFELRALGLISDGLVLREARQELFPKDTVTWSRRVCERSWAAKCLRFLNVTAVSAPDHGHAEKPADVKATWMVAEGLRRWEEFMTPSHQVPFNTVHVMVRKCKLYTSVR